MSSSSSAGSSIAGGGGSSSSGGGVTTTPVLLSRKRRLDENLSPQAIARLSREITALASNSLEEQGIRFLEDENDKLTEVNCTLRGPEGTPYHGGVFRVRLLLTDFPRSPPRGLFLTKIFHPNVSGTGEICVNTLKRDWHPSLSLRHVMQVIRCLLIVPFAESSLNDEAGKLFMSSYEEFAARAVVWTRVHATSRDGGGMGDRSPPRACSASRLPGASAEVSLAGETAGAAATAEPGRRAGAGGGAPPAKQLRLSPKSKVRRRSPREVGFSKLAVACCKPPHFAATLFVPPRQGRQANAARHKSKRGLLNRL